MPIALGDIPPGFYAGDNPVDAIYAGDELVYALTSLDPVSMYKNGNQTLGTSFADVTAWTADTATYPASVVSSNSLVISGAKSSAFISVELSVTNTSFVGARTIQIQLVLDSTTIYTSSAVSIPLNTTQTVSFSTNHAVSDGQLLKLQALASAVTSVRINSGTGSYVRVT